MATADTPGTPQEFRRWDFWVPSGGSSYSPARAFDMRERGEFETLYDIAYYDDKRRFFDSVRESGTRPFIDKILANKPIRVYRTGIAGRFILPGSFVTESKAYAVQHGKNNIRTGKPVLYTLSVRPNELVTLGDPHEFLYIPEDVNEAFDRFEKQMRG